MDDQIAQFRSVTNASLETAIHILEACGGNLETAIDFFFLHGNDGNDQDGPSSSGGGASAGLGDLSAEELVRPPIASKSGVLVEESFQSSYAPLRRPKQASSVFTKFRDFEAETKAKEERIFGSTSKKGASSGMSESKQKRLETLFRPPLEIMHRGTLETAKDAAVSEGFWLMVNVQKTDEFACQALNRDVWNNSAVQAIIKGNFVFWQIYTDSADGQRFETYYRVHSYPFVCILDPRTGELLTTLKTNDASVFCDTLTSFMERNPSFKALDSHLKNGPIDMEAISTSTATIPKNRYETKTSGLKNGGKRRLVQNGSNKTKYDDQEMETEFEEPKSKHVRMEDEDSSSGVSTSSAASYVTKVIPHNPGPKIGYPNVHEDAPASGNADVKLMFRLPDGGKRYLNASKRATVQEVLAYAENEWHLHVSDHDFVMNYPTRRLNKEDPLTTLEGLGVKKQDVVYIEEN